MQLFQDCLGLSWGRIRGDFTSSQPDGRAFPPGHADLQAALIPVFDRARQQLAPRANYGKIGQVKQSDTENPHEYMDRLRPVFRQNSGLNYADDPQSPYQQQFKRDFIKGLLPRIRPHVEKYWVTQDTGTVDEALQYANHAQTVVKNKEKASVFALDTDTALTAFSGSGGYRGGFRVQRRGREEECIEEEQEAEGDREAHTPQMVTLVLHAGGVGKKVTLHTIVGHRECPTQND